MRFRDREVSPAGRRKTTGKEEGKRALANDDEICLTVSWI
jgi:hypothetical protein